MERTFFNTPLPNGRFFRIIFSFEPPREEDDAPSPKKKEHQCAMIDDTEGTTKENARKKRFFLRFRAAYDRGESSNIIFFTHKKNKKLFKNYKNTQQNVCHASEN